MAPLPFALLMGAFVVPDGVAFDLSRETNDFAKLTVGPISESHSNLMRAVGGQGTRVIISADAQVSASLLHEFSASSPSSAPYTESSDSLCTMDPNGGAHSAYCSKALAGLNDDKDDCLGACKGLKWYVCTAAQYTPDVCTLFVDDATVHGCPQGYVPNDASAGFQHPHIAIWVAQQNQGSVCFIQDVPIVHTGQSPGLWAMLTTEQKEYGNEGLSFGGSDCNATSPTGQNPYAAMVATLWECENKCLNEAVACNAINLEPVSAASSQLKCGYFKCSDVMNPTYADDADNTRKAYIYRPH